MPDDKIDDDILDEELQNLLDQMGDGDDDDDISDEIASLTETVAEEMEEVKSKPQKKSPKGSKEEPSDEPQEGSLDGQLDEQLGELKEGQQEGQQEKQKEQQSEQPQEKKQEEPLETSAEVPEFAPPEITLRADDLVAEDARRFDIDEIAAVPKKEEAPPTPAVDLQKYLDTLDDITKEVLDSCRSDRQETQTVIDLCKQAVEDAHSASKSPSRMWVDGLVKAVEVKAGISTNAIKALDSISKMLSATKAGGGFNQQINVAGGGGSEDLTSVLSKGLSEDDEY